MTVLIPIRAHYLSRLIVVHRRLLAASPDVCGVAWANRLICTILDGRPMPADVQQWAEELERQAERLEAVKGVRA